MEGVDISSYQGDVDFVALKASGRDFVIIKASEGNLLVDDKFNESWPKAKEAGLVRGAYHFLRPDLGNAPEDEAKAFVQTVQNAGLETGDILFVDVERVTQNHGNGPDPTGEIVYRFTDEVQAITGQKCPIYSNLDGLQSFGINYDRNRDVGLWLAEPSASELPPPPAGWPVVAFWQHGTAQAGEVPGVASSCDLDTFNGDMAALAAYGRQDGGGQPNPAPEPAPGPAPAPEPSPAPTDVYTVQPGDSLSTIALKLGVDEAELYADNRAQIEADAQANGQLNSANGHWIYPGTVLVVPGSNPVGEHAYTVQPGDSLSLIAMKTSAEEGREITWEEIYDLNRAVIGPNPDLIYPGQVLEIPN